MAPRENKLAVQFLTLALDALRTAPVFEDSSESVGAARRRQEIQELERSIDELVVKEMEVEADPGAECVDCMNKADVLVHKSDSDTWTLYCRICADNVMRIESW